MQFSDHQELGRKLSQVFVEISKKGWLILWGMLNDFLKKYEE